MPLGRIAATTLPTVLLALAAVLPGAPVARADDASRVHVGSE